MSPNVLNAEWRHLEARYDVVLPDALGHPMLAFRDGYWYRFSAESAPRPMSARSAIFRYPEAAGSIVQVICWWMREHRYEERALDLATELALAVSEITRLSGIASRPRSSAPQNALPPASNYPQNALPAAPSYPQNALPSGQGQNYNQGYGQNGQNYSQGYPPGSAGYGQNYPAQNYPAQQGQNYPPQNYPPQNYPPQNYPPQNYPGQG